MVVQWDNYTLAFMKRLVFLIEIPSYCETSICSEKIVPQDHVDGISRIVTEIQSNRILHKGVLKPNIVFVNAEPLVGLGSSLNTQLGCPFGMPGRAGRTIEAPCPKPCLESMTILKTRQYPLVNKLFAIGHGHSFTMVDYPLTHGGSFHRFPWLFNSFPMKHGGSFHSFPMKPGDFPIVFPSKMVIFSWFSLKKCDFLIVFP